MDDEKECFIFTLILQTALRSKNCGHYGWSWEGDHEGEPLFRGDPISQNRMTQEECRAVDTAKHFIYLYMKKVHLTKV